MTTIIDVQNLNKSFSTKMAVMNVNITINQGEICGFLGPNGSGKTTTLRMLCGLLTPDSGQGHCLGYDIIKQSYQIKRQIGYMTQSFSLYQDLTTYENLKFIAHAYQVKNYKKQIAHYLDLFHLQGIKKQLAGSLSGGMKQRLALAGCLLHQPQLLLLDEPTAGVDPKVRREFWDEIHLLSQQGITTLVSTHYMDEAERCTKLIYIAYGHLLAQGSAQDIIEKTKLHTWEITGKQLIPLKAQLEQQAFIEQVAFFGNKLHVSGKDPLTLEQAINHCAKEARCRKIQPNLEDAFIYFVKKAGGQNV